MNKNEDSKRPLVSVIYKMSGDGNQKGRLFKMKKIIVFLTFLIIVAVNICLARGDF